MKNVLFLICAVSLFAAGLASVAHAHADLQGSDQHVELNMDQDNTDNEVADPVCDLHCAHTHTSFMGYIKTGILKSKLKLLYSALSDSPVPSFIYGFKRPPRI